MSGITLRPVGAGDEAPLFALFCQEREAPFRALGWTDAQVGALLRAQFDAQSHGWRQRFPSARFDAVMDDGVLIGRLYVERTPEAIRLIDTALTAERRGRGLGTALLRALLDEAAGAGLPVVLHVDHGNPARRLYERLGFAEVGRDELRAAMRWAVTT